MEHWHQVETNSAEMPEEDKESASTSFDTHSASAISSAWDESSRGQATLVFAPPKRGLPSLNRGYSTPDPSPSHLPKCGALELTICVPRWRWAMGHAVVAMAEHK
eukprot:s265_g1.t1